MSNKKRLDAATLISVTLTGTVFGVLAGLVYQDESSWVAPMLLGAILGSVGGYGLAKLYLHRLAIIFSKQYSRYKTWESGTAVAILCGILCTAFIHAILIVAFLTLDELIDEFLADEYLLIAAIVVGFVGAGVGFILGGILTYLYVLAEMGKATKISNLLKLLPIFAKCFFKLPVLHLVYMARLLRDENPHTHNRMIYVNSFFPAYPSGAFDKLFETIFNGWRVPFSTYFAVTDQCPYNCSHCSYGKHVKGSLDTQKAIEVIEQIKSIGTITIGFTGGEPLVRDDIVQLVKSVGDDTASIMFSTGYNLTSELAKELFDAGLDCMTIGIESDNPEEHDRTRCVSGSFETATNAIRMSLDAGIYTAISTVASRDKLNSGMLERLAEFAKTQGVHEFRILEPIPTGSLSEHDEEILTADESKQIAKFHKQWNRRGEGPAITSFAHLESDETFGCGAGFHHLFVDAVGNVCPCDLTPLKLGNVLEEPLYDIWNRMSKWFDMPRCGCLMKELCGKSDVMHEGAELPICKETSEQLCEQFKREDKLPTVFANLFRHRKPSNPPLNRQQSEKPLRK